MSIPLSHVVEKLEAIAPTRFAADWDNVGLLVEPRAEHEVSCALFTIDLTLPVLEEAITAGAELVVSYHPPIFAGLKRLTVTTTPTVLGAIGHGLAVYSPHTALDAAPGGVNDWLAEAIGAGETAPLEPHPDDAAVGMGRHILLDEPASLDDIVTRVKAHLGLGFVRVAASARHHAGERVRSAAVCAGAGGSVLAPLTGIDLYLTGEMRHHDTLAKVAQGSTVILCDHTNTERGYLPRLARRLAQAAGIETRVSARDRDPLQIV